MDAILEFTHLVSHFLIFAAYIAAVLRVPTSFRALIHIRRRTMIAGAGFFLFCGLTHLGLATHNSEALFYTITDHLQAVAIITFLICLSGDLGRALSRLRLAFKVIQEQYGADGERMIATITAALQGTKHG